MGRHVDPKPDRRRWHGQNQWIMGSAAMGTFTH